MKTQTTIRKTKWFWPWQDAQEEAWLEQMSQHGLHLQKVGYFARYSFIQGQPQSYTYRMDFQDALKTKSKEQYLQLFSDAGWEHLGAMSGWQYFRKPRRSGEARELFTDADTKVQKYRRYLTYLVSYLAVLITFAGLWGNWPGWVIGFHAVVILLCAVYSVVAWMKFDRRIKQLQPL